MEKFTGEHGLNGYIVKSPNGIDSIQVYEFGGHLTSYKKDGKEIIFVSSKSNLDGKKPIRGGIPICFPQFGPGKLVQHGFARSSTWTFKNYASNSEASTLSLELHSSEETIKLWEHNFVVVLDFILSNDELKVEMHVENTDSNSFEFTLALHTYFKADIFKTTISTLKGLEYLDKVKSGEKFTEENDKLTFNGETDRVYKNGASHLELHTGSNGVLKVSKSDNLKDFVVWNPWIEKAKLMADFGDDEYKDMVCIEPANAVVPIKLDSKQKVTFTHNIKQI
eukprot:TRINITY_DN6849_c0_g1_i1.p1 TRINITY_DN6849_c0_g1~~TRINITY_DN6849_c0_g1_i1.p1  ORF type:complete len:312 (-),score=80.87 TRINITY_DN6849_c0_g1_i1:17-856(-)